MIPILLETYPRAPLQKLREALDAGDLNQATAQLDALRRQAAVQLGLALAASMIAGLVAWALV